jgi:hypothetical protein
MPAASTGATVGTRAGAGRRPTPNQTKQLKEQKGEACMLFGKAEQLSIGRLTTSKRVARKGDLRPRHAGRIKRRGQGG